MPWKWQNATAALHFFVENQAKRTQYQNWGLSAQVA